MSDPRIQQWAEVLVRYSVNVEPGKIVGIQGDTSAGPLLRALYQETLKAGGVPVMLPILPGLRRDLMLLANDAQLETITPLERFMREQADITIQVMAESNTRDLTGINPSRQSSLRNCCRSRPRGRRSEMPDTTIVGSTGSAHLSYSAPMAVWISPGNTSSATFIRNMPVTCRRIWTMCCLP